MALVTTTRSGAIRQKPFAWSFSRMKNFEVCPKRHWEIDLQKNYREPDSEHLRWGDVVHKAMAARCGPDRVPLPDEVLHSYPHAEVWAAKCIGNRGEVLVEQGLAITANFAACDNFANDVWMRVKADFIRIVDDVALAVDWKTGKVLEDSVQLALTAAVIFAKYPQVKAVRSVYVWLKEDCESTETFYREDMPMVWRSVWPRIEAMENAHKFTDYPPKPSGMCRNHCVVKSCPHNGKSSR